MQMVEREQELQQQILEAVGASPNVMIWRQNAGRARSMDGKRIIKLAVKGAADLGGFIAPTGRYFEMEIKRPGEKQTPQQENRERVVRQMGGLYAVVRSVEEAQRFLAEAVLGEMARDQGGAA